MNTARVLPRLIFCCAVFVGCSDSPLSSDPGIDSGDAGALDADDRDVDVAEDSGDTGFDADDAPLECPEPSPVPQTSSFVGPCRIETRPVAVPEFGRIEVFRYDSQGRNVSYSVDGDMSSREIPDGAPEEVTTYVYGSEGRLNERRVTDNTVDTESIWKLIYNDSGFLAEEQQTVSQASGTGPGVLQLHRADECGRLARTEIYRPGSWRELDTADLRTYHYGPSGHLKEIRSYHPEKHPKDGHPPVVQFEMEYDDVGRILRSVVRYRDRPEQTVTTVHEYDGGQQANTRQYRGEPPELRVYKAYEYDSESNLIGIDIFDPDDTHTMTTAISYECW